MYAADQSHIVIHDGTIREFPRGVGLLDTAPYMQDPFTSGHLVHDMLFDQIQWIALDIRGAGTEIRDNVFSSGKGPSSVVPHI